MNIFSVIAPSVLLCIIGLTETIGAPVDCAEPDNLTARFEELNTGINTTQFYFPPSLSDITESESQDVLNFINERQQQYQDYAGTECPPSLPSTGNYPIEVRSLCPWYYTSVHDPAYFPATISMAAPRCKTCVGLDNKNVCEMLYQTITILRRDGCVEGLYRYVEVQKSIPVGSVCARRREVESAISEENLSFRK